jgi:capsular polysaccharide biosynthesis protein
MENTPELQKDDEISLLDLFALLLRYRKLVICITLISVVLAVAGYFFYPSYQYKNAVKKGSFQARALFTIKQQALPFVTVSLERIISDEGIILDSMKDSGMDTFQGLSLSDETERSKILFLLNELIEDTKNNILIIVSSLKYKTGTTSASNIQGDNAVVVLFRNKNLELVKSFIQSLFTRSNEKIVNYLRSDLEAIVQNYERLKDISGGSQAAQQFLAENFAQYTFLKNVLDGEETLLVQIGETVITDEVSQYTLTTLKNSYKIKGVIVVFAGLFIACFIVFLLNAVDNIKKDEEAMKKIRGALEN